MSFEAVLVVVGLLWFVIGATACYRITDPYKVAVAVFGGQIFLCVGQFADGLVIHSAMQFLINFLIPAAIAEISILSGYVFGNWARPHLPESWTGASLE